MHLGDCCGVHCLLAKHGGLGGRGKAGVFYCWLLGTSAHPMCTVLPNGAQQVPEVHLY